MKKIISTLLAIALIPTSAFAYTIAPGDTLSKLAERFDTTVSHLVEMNDIVNPDLIFAGQELFTPEDFSFGATPLPEDGYDTFLTAPISDSATTIFVNTLPTVVTESIYTLFGSDRRTVSEKVYCTGTTTTPSNALTGCVRGLAVGPSGGVIDETAGTGSSHSRNARIAITDNINFSGKALSILFGNQPTAANNFDLGTATSTDGDKCFRFDDGDTDAQICKDTASANLYWTIDNGLNTYNFTSSTFTVLTASSTRAIGITDSEIHVNASTTLGYTFGPDGYLYRPVSSTTGIEADADGLKLNTSTISNLISTTTPTANLIPKADSNGKIDSDWVSQTVTFGDGSDGAGTISTPTTLTTDMYYTDLTIQTGQTLDTSGFRVFVTGTLTFEGTGKIINNGANGGNGQNGQASAGGTGGSAGAAAHTGGSLPDSKAGAVGGVGAVNSSSGLVGLAGVTSTKSVGGLGVAGGIGGASAGTSGSCGSGGAGTGGAGGIAGPQDGTVYNSPRSIWGAYLLYDIVGGPATLTGTSGTGGSGGGAGGCYQSSGADSGNGGGGAGSGSPGGFVWVAASRIVTVDGNTYIQAIGGDGGNGGAGESVGGNNGGGSGGGAGSGGTGGTVILIYSQKTGTGTVDVSGGSAGTPGAGGTGLINGLSGGAGVTGGTGAQYIIQI